MADEMPSVVVLLPVFNDWQALSLLLPRVASYLAAATSQFGILIVDDRSTVDPGSLQEHTARGADWVRVLRLRRNLGHQRAFAVALSYIDEHVPCDAVIVMDADGEDRPDDLPSLLSQFHARAEPRLCLPRDGGEPKACCSWCSTCCTRFSAS